MTNNLNVLNILNTAINRHTL